MQLSILRERKKQSARVLKTASHVGCEHADVVYGSIFVSPSLQHPAHQSIHSSVREAEQRSGAELVAPHLVSGFLPANCGIAPSRKW